MDKEDPKQIGSLYSDSIDEYYTGDRSLSLVSTMSKLVASGTSDINYMCYRKTLCEYNEGKTVEYKPKRKR